MFSCLAFVFAPTYTTLLSLNLILTTSGIYQSSCSSQSSEPKININMLKSAMKSAVVFFRRLVRRVKHSIFRKPQQLHEMQTVESSSDNLASLVTLE